MICCVFGCVPVPVPVLVIVPVPVPVPVPMPVPLSLPLPLPLPYVLIGRAEFHGGITTMATMAKANQIRWNGFSWVLIASRPGYRQPWPLGLPRPLGLLQHGKGQAVSTLTPLVVPPRLPKNPPWLPPLGVPGGSLRESRAPAHRIRTLARKPCKEPFLPGIQIIRLTDPDYPDDIDRSTLLSRPHAELCRIRLGTTSKDDIVHLTASPGHPAGVGRARIEALGTEPVFGRAPWAQAWGAPALTPDCGFD
jgi:hypothetical protein